MFGEFFNCLFGFVLRIGSAGISLLLACNVLSLFSINKAYELIFEKTFDKILETPSGEWKIFFRCHLGAHTGVLKCPLISLFPG